MYRRKCLNDHKTCSIYPLYLCGFDVRIVFMRIFFSNNNKKCDICHTLNVVIFSDATFKMTVQLTGFTVTTENVINRNYTVENQTVQGIHIRPKVKENFFVFAAIGVAVIAFFLFVMLLYFRFVQRKNQNPNPVAVDFW